MVHANLDLNKEENQTVEMAKAIWNLPNKNEAIKKIISAFAKLMDEKKVSDLKKL